MSEWTERHKIRSGDLRFWRYMDESGDRGTGVAYLTGPQAEAVLRVLSAEPPVATPEERVGACARLTVTLRDGQERHFELVLEEVNRITSELDLPDLRVEAL